MENVSIRLHPSTELELEELTPFIIKSDCKRWRLIHARLEAQLAADPRSRYPAASAAPPGQPSFSVATSTAPTVLPRPPPAPRRTGSIHGVGDLPAEPGGVDSGQGSEVCYSYSTPDSGYRIFRTGGQVGVAQPDPMPRKAVYRLLPIQPRPGEGYLNTEGFSWIIYATNWPIDPAFAKTDALKFLFDTGTASCHAYYDGTTVGKPPALKSLVDHYPGITVLKQAEGIRFSTTIKGRVIWYSEGSTYHVDAATLDLHIPSLELLQGGSVLRSARLVEFSMAINQIVSEKTAAEDQGTGLDGVLGFGIPPAQRNRIHDPIYTQVNRLLQREGFARSRQFMIDLTGGGPSEYERVVLAPSEKYLNALGTWTPTITVEAIGESWGITPSEVFLRHNGVLHDLNAQLSEGASQRAKIRFLLDTGAVNHYFTHTLLQAIQQNIAGAKIQRASQETSSSPPSSSGADSDLDSEESDEENSDDEDDEDDDEDDEDDEDDDEDDDDDDDNLYNILTFPARYMLNPPSLVLRFATRTPARADELQQIEVPLCPRADPDGNSGDGGVTSASAGMPSSDLDPDLERPIAAYCLSSRASVAALGAGRISVLGSLFFKQYMVHFIPEAR